MIVSVKFEDNSIKVKKALADVCESWLYEASGLMEAQVKRNTPVDTGQLKGSWQYKVDISEMKSTIGSNLENAIWNEYGTGQYALNGDGRKTPWFYTDRKGNGHFTHGKRPVRSLHNAFESLRERLQKQLETKLKGLNK